MKLKFLFLLTLCACLVGCATTSQMVKTMDGDVFKQTGGALFSKQKYMHGLEADFYPNNSGAHISVQGEGDQDSTDALKTINLLIGAMLQMQAAQSVYTPRTMELNQVDRIEKHIQEMADRFEGFRVSPK